MAGTNDYSEINRILQFIEGDGIDLDIQSGFSDRAGTDVQVTVSLAGTMTGNFFTDGNFAAQEGNTAQVAIGAYGPSGEATVLFGSAADVSIYRSGVNSIKVLGNLEISGSVVTATAFTSYGGGMNAINGAYIASAMTANTTTVFDSYVSGDTQVRFLIAADGKMTFGNGSVAGDTNLYRGGNDRLQTDDAFYVGNNIFIQPTGGMTINLGGIATNVLTAGVPGDAESRFQIQETGKIEWGPGGSTARDTNLYRYGANGLATDDYFYAKGQFIQADGYFTTGTGGVILSEANAGGYIEIDEATGDAGGATDKVRLFCKDVAGKTKLYAVFQTGAIQLVATEP